MSTLTICGGIIAFTDEALLQAWRSNLNDEHKRIVDEAERTAGEYLGEEMTTLAPDNRTHERDEDDKDNTTSKRAPLMQERPPTMPTIDESLKSITGATHTRWVEHDTPNGNWSRRQFQKTVRTITPEQVRYLATHPLPGEKRRHKRGTPLPVRIVVEHDEHTRRVSTLEYHQ